MFDDIGTGGGFLRGTSDSVGSSVDPDDTAFEWVDPDSLADPGGGVEHDPDREPETAVVEAADDAPVPPADRAESRGLLFSRRMMLVGSATAAIAGVLGTELADRDASQGSTAAELPTGTDEPVFGYGGTPTPGPETTATSTTTPTATATATETARTQTDTATATPTPTSETVPPGDVGDGGRTETPTPTPEPTATPTPTPSGTDTDPPYEFGEQGYGEYGYGGYLP